MGDILDMCVLLCKVIAWSTIFASLMETFLVVSDFTKHISISIRSVPAAWGSNVVHWSPLESTMDLAMMIFLEFGRIHAPT